MIEAGSDLGGTWYELALPKLWKEWTWTEKFPRWQELQAYFAYVGRARWDDQLHLWHATAKEKDKATAPYLILCTAIASKPHIPNIKGHNTSKGPRCHIRRWPTEGIETTGKRVGIIGTGASGVQAIQEIGLEVAHPTVFQRTPNLALPIGQYSVSKQVQDHFEPVYDELHKELNTTYSGFPNEHIPRPLLGDSEEREANFERLGGFHFSLSNYQNLLLDRTGNDVAYVFWRRKVSERTKDPEKRALLAPAVAPHPFAAKRPSLEQRFYETFNQDNVDLVDIKATPILEMHGNGLKAADKEDECDVLAFATGFDSYVGGFDVIDLRGLNGETIQDHWKELHFQPWVHPSVFTHGCSLGLTIVNFSNLFFTTWTDGVLQRTDLFAASRCIDRPNDCVLARAPHHQVYPDNPCCVDVQEIVGVVWYMGADIPEQKREAYNFTGEVVGYKQEIIAEIERGYSGFLKEGLGFDCI